jgi:hypothetical protein
MVVPGLLIFFEVIGFRLSSTRISGLVFGFQVLVLGFRVFS